MENKKNQEMKNENSIIEEKLKEILTKSADLMVFLISIQESVKFYKNFNFSANEEYKKGFNKAFEIIEKIVFKKEENKC